MAKLNIDFSKVEASSGPVVLPTGWQRATMIESEHAPTSNNATTGNEVIKTKFKIMDGPYMNQVLFKQFNVKNANEQAQSIGWGEMKALNDALGLIEVPDTELWHNKPVLIHVKVKAARRVENPVGSGNFTDYDASNDINGFKAVTDTTVEVNHNVKATSGGSAVTVSGGFANGGSPVPAVGTQAPSGLAAVMAQAAVPASTVTPAAPAAPTAPTAPAAPAAPVVAAAPVFVLTMTAKANGMTKEQFVAADPAWQDDQMLITHGYAEMVEQKPAAPLAPAAPVAPSAPASPAAPATPAVATAAGNGAAVPPWLAGK